MHIRQVVVGNQLGRELFRFVGRRTVAYGNQRDMMFFYEAQYRFGSGGFRSVALRYLNYAVVDHMAGGIDNCHLAARAVAGVKA